MRSFFDKPQVQIDGLFDAVDGAGIGILPVLVRIVKNGRFVVVRDPEGVIREAAEVVVDVAGVLVEVNARGIGQALDDGAEGDEPDAVTDLAVCTADITGVSVRYVWKSDRKGGDDSLSSDLCCGVSVGKENCGN